MLKYKLIVLLFFLSIIAHSQVIRFDNLYDFYGSNNNDGAIAILVEQNNYLLGGLARDSIYNRLHLAFLKLDLNGNTLFLKSYGSPNTDYFMGLVGSLVKTYDSGYIVGGSINIGTGVSMIMKLNSNGDSLWTKLYGDSIAFEAIYQIKQTKDSGFICVGAYNPTGPALLDILLIKTDSIGNVQWRKTLGSSGLYEQGFSVQQTFDGGYIVGCNKIGAGANDPLLTYILKLDSAGNVQWPYSLPHPFSSCGSFVIQTPDSGYLANACFTAVSNGPSRQSVFKLNPNGQLMWQKHIGPEGTTTGFCQLYETNDGNYIYAAQGDPCCGSPVGNTVDGRIIKISPQGDSLWYRSYYPTTANCSGLCDQNYLRDIKPTPDGGYIACGFVADQLFQDMWVIKVDSTGCVDTLCVVTGLFEQPKANIPVTIYPNPAHNDLTVSASLFRDAVLTVYDLSGRALMQQVYSKEAVINVSALKAGMYVITLQAEKERAVSKFVKQ